MDQTQTYAQNDYARNQTIVGYFDSSDRAQRALEELRDAGFTSAHLGVAHRGSSAAGSAAGQAAHKAEDAGHSVWDKVKSFFEGGPENYADERTQGDFGTREITDPNANSAFSTSGYSHDDLHGSLTSMSVPEHRSRYFNQRFRSSDSGSIVTVNASGRAPEAERILRDNGADLGDTASENADYSSGAYAGSGRDFNSPESTSSYSDRDLNAASSGFDRNNVNQDINPTGRDYAEAGTESTGREFNRNDRDFNNNDRDFNRTEGLQNIQLLGEVLRVHKDRLNRGEVVVRKDIVTETQTVQVPVTREELVIEQHDVAGDTPARGNIGDDREIRIPLTEETASVDKGTVVRQEVAVGKKPVQEVRDLSGEVRREELVVDDSTTKRAVNE